MEKNGVFCGAFTKKDPARFAHQVAEMFRLYRAGQIRPRVSETYPLAQAAVALNRIADRKATGKIVLTI